MQKKSASQTTGRLIQANFSTPIPVCPPIPPSPYPYPMVLSSSSEDFNREPSCSTNERYHPYDQKPKSRKQWPHALEKPLFNLLELTTLGAPNRRPIYIASLEAHIDRLHTQLLSLGPQFYPVTTSELDEYKGLNTKTCKSMVSGFQCDITRTEKQLLELERANQDMEEKLRDLDST
ncbi:hypothetical protein C8J57DRAFT_1269572 [Mycena rebaudengoi]|nr:hypothetical protein C8J57DRAFT_1269572 [Mycena rebaudengoi]